MNRLVLYPKDIEYIIGKKRAAVKKVCSKIRAINNKPDHIPITVNEFCNYFHMDPEMVLRILR
jgi:cell fate (sporulation/competence/biofilm development) regulator YmcA (YheA/YmcA/DUF963 family)